MLHVNYILNMFEDKLNEKKINLSKIPRSVYYLCAHTLRDLDIPCLSAKVMHMNS